MSCLASRALSGRRPYSRTQNEDAKATRSRSRTALPLPRGSSVIILQASWRKNRLLAGRSKLAPAVLDLLVGLPLLGHQVHGPLVEPVRRCRGSSAPRLSNADQRQEERIAAKLAHGAVVPQGRAEALQPASACLGCAREGEAVPALDERVDLRVVEVLQGVRRVAGLLKERLRGASPHDPAFVTTPRCSPSLSRRPTIIPAIVAAGVRARPPRRGRRRARRRRPRRAIGAGAPLQRGGGARDGSSSRYSKKPVVGAAVSPALAGTGGRSGAARRAPARGPAWRLAERFAGGRRGASRTSQR